MAINRVSTYSQQQQNLINLLGNEGKLSDVLLQQSTGLKAPTYSGIASQAGHVLNVSSISDQAQSFLDNIASASTRLSLTDTTLKSIGSIARNFQQELQQLQNNPSSPNINELAKTSLQQLASLLDSSDGTQFLFAGSQQSAPPVAALNTARIPTSSITLAGNLDTNGIAPANGNAVPPTPGSYVDVNLSGQDALFDSNGIQYDASVRFVHQSTTQWQAYLVGLTRSDDNSKAASYNGLPISAGNAVPIGAAFDPSVNPPFNQINNVVPANALAFNNVGTAGIPQIALPAGGGTLDVKVDANAITNTAASSAVTQIDNATPTTQIVLNQLNLDPTTPVGDTATVTLSGAKALFASGAGALAGSDKFDATIKLTKTQQRDNAGGLSAVGGVIPLATQGAGYTAATTTVTFPPPPNGGTTATGTANVVAGAVVSITITNPGSGYPYNTPTVGTITDTSGGAGAVVPALSPRDELWRADLVSLTDSTTGATVTTPAITAGAPYVIGTFNRDQIPITHGIPFSIDIGANAAPTLDANGTSFQMNAANRGLLQVTLRNGSVTHNPTGTVVTQATANAPGTPQLIEVSANLSSGTPINISVAQATSGSYADISFQNADALVDANGEAHNATFRLVKTVRKGSTTFPALPANDLYQLYAIGMTRVKDGKDSTNPPLSAASPLPIGTPFAPAAGTTLTFSPALASGAAMNVTLPITATTFTTGGGNITLGAAQDTTTSVSTTAQGQLNLVGNLSTAAVAVPGTLSSILLPSAGTGTGFAVADTITFNTPAGGVAGVATVTSIGAGGVITGISVTTPGSGYTATPTIAATSGAGTGASLQPVLAPAAAELTNPIGGIRTIAVATGGSGYVAGDIITLAAPPGGRAATATVTAVAAGVITGVTLLDPGAGYSSTATVAIAGNNHVGTGGTISITGLVAETTNNTFDVNFSGPTALRDSTGKAYNATVRLQYSFAGASTPGWRAYLTNLTDPATGVAAVAGLPIAIGAPPFDVFHAQDAAHGTVTIPANGPKVINIAGTGGTLPISIPFNSTNFSATSAVTSLNVGGQSTTSLSAGIADASYFRPGGTVSDTSQQQLQFRTSADSVVSFGIRADNQAFEQLFRVLNFFRAQSVPSNATEVGTANTLLNSVLGGVNLLRGNVANTQTRLNDEKNFHTTTINLAKDDKAAILQADPTVTAMNLNAMSNLLQESFATLGVVKGLSLVNYLK